MVIERCEFKIVPGREEEFLGVLESQRAFLESRKGAGKVSYGRGVEDPNKVILYVSWDSVEIHKEATQSAEWPAFRETLKGFIAGASVEHFDMRVL
jgi:heme-degrading monooxygenase HmoA